MWNKIMSMKYGIIIAAVLVNTPVLAQAISALKNHDTKSPIDIAAERFEVRDRERQALFLGAVKIKQGNLTLNSAKVRVFYDRTSSANPTIKRVDAQGDVDFSSPSERAKAAWAIYDVEQGQLTLGGNVNLTRGTDIVQGQRMEINLRTGVTTLDGGISGQTKPTTPQTGSDGRVRARFSVPERKPAS
jgi:lipopolysaccharide export system protein LptA